MERIYIRISEFKVHIFVLMKHYKAFKTKGFKSHIPLDVFA